MQDQVILQEDEPKIKSLFSTKYCIFDFQQPNARFHNGQLGRNVQYPVERARSLENERSLYPLPTVPRTSSKRRTVTKETAVRIRQLRSQYHQISIFVSIFFKFYNTVVLIIQTYRPKCID